MRNLLAATCLASTLFAACAGAEEPAYSAPDATTDALVEQCRHTVGVRMIEGTDVLCFNEAIFPGTFLELTAMPTSSRTIFSSPGGHVVTAQLMSKLFDQRGDPVTIAGPCMSACAMIILPGLDDAYIHRSAHIAVHGLTHESADSYFEWLNGDEPMTSRQRMGAMFGTDMGWSMYNMKWLLNSHLKGQNVDQAYATEVAARMKPQANSDKCRVDFRNYWGMLDASYLRKHLGAQVTGIEDFIQSFDDPRNYFRPTTHRIGPQEYVFNDKYANATCSEGKPILVAETADEGVPGTGEDSGAGASGWQAYLNEIKAYEKSMAK